MRVLGSFTEFSDPKGITRVLEQHWWVDIASPLPWALHCQPPERREVPSSGPLPVRWAGRGTGSPMSKPDPLQATITRPQLQPHLARPHVSVHIPPCGQTAWPPQQQAVWGSAEGWKEAHGLSFILSFGDLGSASTV